ncbi:DUF2235 domain-containing protein [Rhizobium jaguaris]|nr:DUF2235 domain-containing protein [Rhizobium jaguaris]
MATKRIILLLDGTWNDEDIGPYDTNIVRLQTIIAEAVGSPASSPPSPRGPASSTDAKLVKGFTSDGQENIVYYERGVGTSAHDRFRGGAFGDGLALKVRRAYKFLSFHFTPGDSVFIFGFSRGAYTARSLVGYLGAAGLLKREHCTDKLEPLAWGYYRTDPNDRLPGTWCELKQYTHDQEKFSVDCIGVFDTVGALGVPLDPFFLANRDRFAFHNVDLSSITKVNLHAVAIDEHRKPFEATVWRKPRFKSYESFTEQVWFSGAHGDIGGGYIPEELRAADYPQALDDISLDWMLRRLKYHFKDFPCEVGGLKSVTKDWSLARQHEPRKSYYKIYPEALRAISNYPLGSLPRRQVEVSRDRHAEPIGEMVHISAIERLGQTIQIDTQKWIYSPRNLTAVLPQIIGTYAAQTEGTSVAHDIRIVDWSGDPLAPRTSKDCEIALTALKAAKERLKFPV